MFVSGVFFSVRRRAAARRAVRRTAGWPATASFCLVALAIAAAAMAQTPTARAGDTQARSATPDPDFHAAEPELREFVMRALDANPGLREAEARHRAALDKPPQVTALPDPTLSFAQMVRSVETRVGPQLNTITVGQAFPWFGKLNLRGQVAESEASAALEIWQARRREVIAQVKSTYYNLAYVDAAIAVSEEEQVLLGFYERLSQDRYTSGVGLQQAVIRIQAELTRSLNRLFSLRQQRTSLVARLNTLVDRAPSEPIPAVPLADPPIAVADGLDVDRLALLGESHRHEIRAADALIERSERAIALARKGYWPDFVIGAGLVNVGRSGPTANAPDAGKNAWMVSVGVSVPVWRDKLRAGVRQAGEDAAAQRDVRAGLVNEMEFDVSDQVGRLGTLADRIRLFENVLITQAREALQSTEVAYQTGQVGVLDLLDSERVLLEVRLVNQRQRADFLIALAELERATGARFPR